MYDVERIKSRHIRLRIIWFIIVVILIFLLYYICNYISKDEVFYTGLAILIAYSLIPSIIIFFISFRTRCLYYKVNGHNFYVCVGFFSNYLIVDDEIVDKTHSSGSHIPPMSYDTNNLHIEVKLGALGGVSFKANNRIINPNTSMDFEYESYNEYKSSNQDETINIVEEIKKLESLKSSCAISEDEFNKIKEKLINNYTKNE